MHPHNTTPPSIRLVLGTIAFLSPWTTSSLYCPFPHPLISTFHVLHRACYIRVDFFAILAVLVFCSGGGGYDNKTLYIIIRAPAVPPVATPTLSQEYPNSVSFPIHQTQYIQPPQEHHHHWHPELLPGTAPKIQRRPN